MMTQNNLNHYILSSIDYESCIINIWLLTMSLLLEHLNYFKGIILFYQFIYINLFLYGYLQILCWQLYSLDLTFTLPKLL